MTRVPLNQMPVRADDGTGISEYPELLNDKLIHAYILTLDPKTSYLNDIEPAPWYGGDLSDYDVEYSESTDTGANQIRPEFEQLSDTKQEIVMTVYESYGTDKKWTINDVVAESSLSRSAIGGYVGEGKDLVEEGWVKYANEKDGQSKLWRLKKSPKRELAVDGGFAQPDRRQERYRWLRYDWSAISTDLERRKIFDTEGKDDANDYCRDWFGSENEMEIVESFETVASMTSIVEEISETRRSLENPHYELPYQVRVMNIRQALAQLEDLKHNIREFFTTHIHAVRDAFGSCSEWFSAESDKTNTEEARYPSNIEERLVKVLSRARTFIEETYLEPLCQRDPNEEATRPDTFGTYLYYTEEVFADFFKYVWQFYQKLIKDTSFPTVSSKDETTTGTKSRENNPMTASPSSSSSPDEGAPSRDELDGFVVNVIDSVLDEPWNTPIGSGDDPEDRKSGSLTWDEFKQECREKSNEDIESDMTIREKLIKYHKWCYYGDGPCMGVYVWIDDEEEVRIRAIKLKHSANVLENYYERDDILGRVYEWPDEDTLTSMMY